MTEGRDEGLGATTEELKELLGEEGARKLAQAFGGRRLYVPVSHGAHHPITETPDANHPGWRFRLCGCPVLVQPCTPVWGRLR